MKRTLSGSLILLFAILFSRPAVAQFFSNNENMIQYLDWSQEELLHKHRAIAGFGLKLSIDISKKAELRLSVTAGVSKTIEYWKGSGYRLMPSYQMELMIYRGGLGTSLLTRDQQKFVVEMMNNINLTFGFNVDDKSYGRPICKLGGNTTNALFDPFKNSLTLGTTFINGLTHNHNQQVGIGSLGFGEFQFMYLNDATPFHWLFLADSYDRWWTGGGHFAWYEPADWGSVTEISLHYDRYTGWQQNAFETAGALQLDYLAYKKKEEVFYNRSRWMLVVGIDNNIQITKSSYNSKREVQEYIHYRTHDPYHQLTQNDYGSVGVNYKLNNFIFFK